MNDPESKMDANFFQLVISLQIASMQYLGKIASPISGKVERNLDQAKVSIDMLAMLSEKTKGNLNSDEEEFLSTALYDLRLNYLDESSKPQPESGDDAASDAGSSGQ
ncbi:hypothetical protein TRIP_C60109 [Candidatus Zixiibacteriota bacterium]|nr:hypothetical protein TRIP_C60109 [candidate division Zixibacteria bacterium]